VLVSSIDPDYNLTVFNAASSRYTLTVMSIVAAIFTPLVLAYQAWTYWVFRHRIGRADLEAAAGLPPAVARLRPAAAPAEPAGSGNGAVVARQ
jgi:cytochrome d ubiquinol oxidase subunit II